MVLSTNKFSNVNVLRMKMNRVGRSRIIIFLSVEVNNSAC